MRGGLLLFGLNMGLLSGSPFGDIEFRYCFIVIFSFIGGEEVLERGICGIAGRSPVRKNYYWSYHSENVNGIFSSQNYNPRIKIR